ncbi:MAG: hypothetical protein EZS28_028011 [Streblomastix strix]|uniref:Uncharacterized protein n=1 Tax=Streblomastix strix TaxID=222440 RepID=A0A5J4V1N9_9EUKA|nr:MAG: hypothetical protein EZS28_028011 [Streblomastix strix]
MNSDKVSKYNPGADHPGAKQNLVNGVIVQRAAAAPSEALISNDFPLVMEMLLTQNHVGRVIARDGQKQREIAVAPPQTKAILFGNTGLSNLIGDDSIERLQKAQKIAKAVGVYSIAVEVLIKIGIQFAYSNPKNYSSEYGNWNNFNQSYGYGYGGNFKGAYRQYQGPFQYQIQIGQKQYPHPMSYMPNMGPRIRYNDQTTGIATAPALQSKQQ